MDPLSIGIIVGSLIVSWLLRPKPQARDTSGDAPFETARIEEGASIPVVLGCAEVAPNLAWVGNILERNADDEVRRVDTERLGQFIPRSQGGTAYTPPYEGWYANMFGVVCQGPVTELVDIKFGDWWVSRIGRGQTPDEPRVSIFPPWPNEGSHLEIFFQAKNWWVEQGGIVGICHFHYGEQTDVVCEFGRTWWGEENASAFPGVAYITFGWGHPSADFDGKQNVAGWASPNNWVASVSPYDRIGFDIGGPPWGEYPWVLGQYNPNYTSPGFDPEGESQNGAMGIYFLPHGKQAAPGGSEYDVHDEDSWDDPNIGNGTGFEAGDGSIIAELEDGTEVRQTMDGAVLDRNPGRDSIVFVNQPLVCFGCQFGYSLAFMPVQGLRPDMQVRVKFKYARISDFYAIRSPRGDWCGDPTSAPEAGIDYSSVVSFCKNFLPDDGDDVDAQSWDVPHTWAGDSWDEQSDCFKVGLIQTFDHTFTMPSAGDPFWTQDSEFLGDTNVFPGGATDFNAGTRFLKIGYSAFWWRSAWWTEQVWDLELIGIPEDTDAPYAYGHVSFNQDGIFYWGRNPTPPSPTCIVRCIPVGVTGEGVGQGANPADAIYEILTNTQWGMGLAPGLIDMGTFEAAGATLAEEGFPISLVLDSMSEAEETIDDILGVIDAVIYTHPNSGLLRLKLLRPDYSISALADVGPDQITDLTMERPDVSTLINEVQVKFRRWRADFGSGAEVTDFILGTKDGSSLPGDGNIIYSQNTWHLIPGYSNISNLVLTQNGVPLPESSYTWTRAGVIFLGYDPAIVYGTADADAEFIKMNFTVNREPAGFEDAVATSTNQATYTMLGEIRSETVNMPMVMDPGSAQRVCERVLMAASRPLRTFRWHQSRMGDKVLPGEVLTLTWPDLRINTAIPVRVMSVDYGTLDGDSVEVEAIEDKWGAIEHLLIFEPAGPPRPPLDFPEGNPAPPPSSLVQVLPSWVRLQIEGQGGSYQIMRNNFLGTELNNTVAVGGYTGAPLQAQVIFDVYNNEFIFTWDDPSPPHHLDGPFYYYCRFMGDNTQTPSIWIGPVVAVWSDGGEPPPGTVQLVPEVQHFEIFDDVVSEHAYILIRVYDPQVRVNAMEYTVLRVIGGLSASEPIPEYNPPVIITDYLRPVDYELKAIYDSYPIDTYTSWWLIVTPLAATLSGIGFGFVPTYVSVSIGYRFNDPGGAPHFEFLTFTINIPGDQTPVTDGDGGGIIVTEPPNVPGPIVVGLNATTVQGYEAVGDENDDLVVGDDGSAVEST